MGWKGIALAEPRLVIEGNPGSSRVRWFVRRKWSTSTGQAGENAQTRKVISIYEPSKTSIGHHKKEALSSPSPPANSPLRDMRLNHIGAECTALPARWNHIGAASARRCSSGPSTSRSCAPRSYRLLKSSRLFLAGNALTHRVKHITYTAAHTNVLDAQEEATLNIIAIRGVFF